MMRTVDMHDNNGVGTAWQRAAQRFALPALVLAAERRPTGKMLRRRKRLGIAPESPALGSRFGGRLFVLLNHSLFVNLGYLEWKMKFSTISAYPVFLVFTKFII